MPIPRDNIPTILVAFGATGDLMRRKVIPALYHLHQHDQLPDKFRVIGFSRREYTDKMFHTFITEVLATRYGTSISKKSLASFLRRFHFQRGDFDEAERYASLKETFDELDKTWGVCSNKLFYFSVAPEFYETIFKHLSKSRLSEPCDPGGGWTRVMVEKPFGVDTKTARKLEGLLGRYFEEEQIY